MSIKQTRHDHLTDIVVNSFELFVGVWKSSVGLGERCNVFCYSLVECRSIHQNKQPKSHKRLVTDQFRVNKVSYIWHDISTRTMKKESSGTLHTRIKMSCFQLIHQTPSIIDNHEW
jgi:hypothetical protein